MEWIKVENKLPKPYKRVLAKFTNGAIRIAERRKEEYSDDIDWYELAVSFSFSEIYINSPYIIEWMEIPE